MRLYNGNNPELKRLLDPNKLEIAQAIIHIFGPEQYQIISQESNRLLIPNAFYEPGLEDRAIYEQGILEARNDTQITEAAKQETKPLKQVIETIEQRLDVPENKIAGYLGIIGLDLLMINEVMADEIAKRISRYMGFEFALIYEKEKPANEFDYMQSEKEKIMREEIAGLSDSNFVHMVQYWNQRLSGMRKNFRVFDQVLTFFEQLEYSKKTLSQPAGEIEDIRRLMHEGEFDYAMASYIEPDLVKGLNIEKNGLIFNRHRIIESSPAIALKKDFNPKKLIPNSTQTNDMLKFQAYLHEYGHFIQYALQKVPSQIVSGLLFYVTQKHQDKLPQ